MFLLTACSGEDDGTAQAKQTEKPEGIQGEHGAQDEERYAAEWYTLADKLSECEEIEALVAPYLEGVCPRLENGEGQYGIFCDWEAPEDNTEFENIRSVGVFLEPEYGEPVDSEPIEKASTLTLIPDDDLQRADGIAYTSDAANAVSAVIYTTVRLPYVEVTIGGGRWGDYPDLDSVAALKLAKKLLGIL